MHVAITAAFMVAFAVVFATSQILWKILLSGLSNEHRGQLIPQLASYLTSFSHGASICCLGVRFLLTAPWWEFHRANTTAQNVALCLSLGYFAADTCVYLIPFSPREVVFILHHVVTALFILASLHTQSGGAAVLLGLFLGEVTNPLYHLYNVLGTLRDTHPLAAVAHRLITPLFTTFFVIVRSILGPPILIWWCSKVLVLNVPLMHRCIWMVASVGITLVSQKFSYRFIKETYDVLCHRERDHTTLNSKMQTPILDSASDIPALLSDKFCKVKAS